MEPWSANFLQQWSAQDEGQGSNLVPPQYVDIVLQEIGVVVAGHRNSGMSGTAWSGTKRYNNFHKNTFLLNIVERTQRQYVQIQNLTMKSD
jgi:hypothetical protein